MANLQLVKNAFCLWVGLCYSVAAAIFYSKEYRQVDISLPWQPLSVLGIAVAFYLGFKNNASYDRFWEARKVWGGIANNSRTFGAALVAFVQGEEEAAIKKKIIFRHIAWLTALRFQLRLAREWEHKEDRVKGVYFPETSGKYFENLDNELCQFLDKEEAIACLSKTSIATQILKYQSVALQAVKDKNYFDDFRHMKLHKLISSFYDDQGRSKRIKNFPFPRQYASAALWQTVIFAMLTPFGMVNVFAGGDAFYFWLSAPFSALIIWMFFLMEKIGDHSENPFEGSYNDTPITSISRSIEIDLRQMIDDENIPAPLTSQDGFLM